MDEKLEQEKRQVTAEKKNKLPVKASMERLGAPLEKLEANDTSLEEAFLLYERGMKLTGEIDERLTSVEGQMEVLEDHYTDTSL